MGKTTLHAFFQTKAKQPPPASPDNDVRPRSGDARIDQRGAGVSRGGRAAAGDGQHRSSRRSTARACASAGAVATASPQLRRTRRQTPCLAAAGSQGGGTGTAGGPTPLAETTNQLAAAGRGAATPSNGKVARSQAPDTIDLCGDEVDSPAATARTARGREAAAADAAEEPVAVDDGPAGATAAAAAADEQPAAAAEAMPPPQLPPAATPAQGRKPAAADAEPATPAPASTPAAAGAAAAAAGGASTAKASTDVPVLTASQRAQLLAECLQVRLAAAACSRSWCWPRARAGAHQRALPCSCARLRCCFSCLCSAGDAAARGAAG